MPTQSVAMNQIDPFIFLNHHGYQQYLPHNQGLPFGPHPHRGFETVTFILHGDLTHKDSSGAQSTIKEGGVQWMTAGSGLIHAEVSSETFKAQGGPLEILQLWVNLPAKFKMTAPKYVGLQKENIPVLAMNDGKVTLHLVAGKWAGKAGAFQPLTDIHLSYITFKEGGIFDYQVPPSQNIFLYVVQGSILVNEEQAHQHHLVEFANDNAQVKIEAMSEALLLFGFATPYHEPMAAYGPFVMNSSEEIQQAYKDYRDGKFGDEEALLED